MGEEGTRWNGLPSHTANHWHIEDTQQATVKSKNRNPVNGIAAKSCTPQLGPWSTECFDNSCPFTDIAPNDLIKQLHSSSHLKYFCTETLRRSYWTWGWSICCHSWESAAQVPSVRCPIPPASICVTPGRTDLLGSLTELLTVSLPGQGWEYVYLFMPVSVAQGAITAYGDWMWKSAVIKEQSMENSSITFTTSERVRLIRFICTCRTVLIHPPKKDGERVEGLLCIPRDYIWHS